MKKYLIVGGVAGGASTAARLRRNDEDAEIILFERSKYISYANCGLPYYIGGIIQNRDKLFVQTTEEFARRFNIDIRPSNDVISIDRRSKKIKVHNLESDNIYEESYDKLVLSPGARPLKPSIPGSELEGIFTIRDVDDTDRIKEFIDTKKPKRAIVIGAGYIGIEMLENLHTLGIDVTLVEMMDRILPFFDFEVASALSRHIMAKGVNVLLNSRIVAFGTGEDSIITTLSNGEFLEGEIIILATGVRPDTGWLSECDIELDHNGSILVDEYLRSNDPDIYAVGDAIKTKHQILNMSYNAYLAGPANKQGRIVADNIVYGDKIKFKGVLGTAIIKVFDLSAGIVGASEHQLKSQGINCSSLVIHSAGHAGYYPGAKPVSIKLLYSPLKGEILGVEIIGYQGIDKRLDVVSALIGKEGTIQDLADFEHAYAPPYSSARDPLTYAGYVGENILSGRFKSIDWSEMQDERFNDALLVDVRTVEEYNCCTIPGSINIPVDELRERIEELPKERDIIIFCLVGRRGYLACRILHQKGFEKVYNLSGGYKTYQFVYCRDKKVDIYAHEMIDSADRLLPECKCDPCPYTI